MDRQFTISNTIKLVSLVVALSSATFAAPSFAAGVTAPGQLIAQAAVNNQAITQPVAQVQQKTRAEVYQELLDSKKSGEFARMNMAYRGH